MSGLKDLVQAAKQGNPPETAKETSKNTPNKLAKSKDPNYTQAMSYLPKSLHRRVKSALLLEENSDIDFSELVGDLLEEWLSKYSNT